MRRRTASARSPGDVLGLGHNADTDFGSAELGDDLRDYLPGNPSVRAHVDRLGLSIPLKHRLRKLMDVDALAAEIGLAFFTDFNDWQVPGGVLGCLYRWHIDIDAGLHYVRRQHED